MWYVYRNQRAGSNILTISNIEPPKGIPHIPLNSYKLAQKAADRLREEEELKNLLDKRVVKRERNKKIVDWVFYISSAIFILTIIAHVTNGVLD